MPQINNHEILVKTRAEEYEADVWEKFFIPPYFNRLSLHTSNRSTYIIGSRGCGKTMLLKYLDYHTAFSKKRSAIPSNETSHIGIYWRVDTQFCNSLKLRGLTEAEWTSVFESYFTLVVSIQIINSLKTISESYYQKYINEKFDNFCFPSMSSFHNSYPIKAQELEDHLISVRRSFSMWISNIRTLEKPLLPAGKYFLDSLISDIRKIKGLEESSFFIYLDEGESLVTYQRRVINTLIKHSQRPLIINFTAKVISRDNKTTSEEYINGTHDFRVINLDDELDMEGDKDLFFAEVFLANYEMAYGVNNTSFLDILRSTEQLKLRKDARYKTEIISKIRKMFPSLTLNEHANNAINTPRILNIIIEKINQSIKYHSTKITPHDFLSYTSTPEAFVLIPTLLHRRKITPEQLLNQLEEYKNSQSGSFQSSWVHNNLLSSLLELYRPYRQLCPVYSGFETFCTLASNNLRHFLILCYKSIEIAELNQDNLEQISLLTQSSSAYETAFQLLKEISTTGELGERLYMFTTRLGNIFRALQANPSLSEPEQNQFTINSGDSALDGDDLSLIYEAKKHFVLIEYLETKTKSKVGSDSVDYQLNPIYSPYFGISYRKKRKINMSVEQFKAISSGSQDEYSNVMKFFDKSSDETAPQLDLGLLN